MSTAVLGRDDIVSIITQSNFYPTGGAFTAVGQIVQENFEQYKKSADKRCCGPDPTILYPAIDKLFVILRDTTETGDAARTAFKEFMSRKKGQPITVVTMYFRRGKEPVPEKLQF